MGRWYILHVRTGQEEKVKKMLLSQQEEGNSVIKQVIIPKEEVSEISHGEKKIKSRRFWPGYILIELDEQQENEIVWHMIRKTTGVLGFLGAEQTPVPLSQEEADKMLNEVEERKSKPTPKVEFAVGDKVEIIDGPFVNFSGIVEEVYHNSQRLKVSVSIFGRATPVELSYWQVEKI
ncbi:MAG: transcription termination/antitermination protein NusG [Actinomycetota bacterium]|nr:transcription termination/antitermination protein NusG [Actinomycetota bacterium]